MIKKLFLLFALVAFMASCNQSTEKNAEKENAFQMPENTLTIDEFYAHADSLVGQEVIITGEVDHVCKHGGTKMVVFNPQTDKSIHVMAPESGNFKADEVMNQDVVVWGTVAEKRIDDAFIANLEDKLNEDLAKGVGEESAEDTEAKEAETHHGEDSAVPENDEKHKKEIEARKKQIQKIKDKLAKMKEEGKDYIPVYSIECTEYKVLADDDNSEEGNAAEENSAEKK